MWCRDKNNPVVVVVNGIDVTLKPTDNELLAAGTVQVAVNGEVSAQDTGSPAAAQTTYIVPLTP